MNGESNEIAGDFAVLSPPLGDLAVDSPAGRQVALILGGVPVRLVRFRWPEDEDVEILCLRAEQLGPELMRRLGLLDRWAAAAADTSLADFLDELASLLRTGRLTRLGYVRSIEAFSFQINDWIESTFVVGEPMGGYNLVTNLIPDWQQDWPEPQVPKA